MAAIFPVAFCPRGYVLYWHFIRGILYGGILCCDILSGHQLESCGYPIVNNKLSCCRDTARRFVAKSLKVTQGQLK